MIDSQLVLHDDDNDVMDFDDHDCFPLHGDDNVGLTFFSRNSITSDTDEGNF